MKSELKALPYPVLGRFTDFVESDFQSTLDFKLDVTPDGDIIVAEYAFLLSCDEINKLINQGQASFAFDIKCTDTLYREVIFCPQRSGTIRFQPGQLYGKGVFEPVVVILKPVNNFSTKDFNPEYEDDTFSLLPGDVVAVDDQVSKFFEFNKLKFESLVRIDTVAELPADIYGFDMSSDVLIIQMGKNFRMVWDVYYQEKDKAPFLAMSVYKDCIHAALEFISKNEQEADSLKWARALKVKLATLGVGKDLSAESDFNALGKLAQQLVSKIGILRLLKNVQ